MKFKDNTYIYYQRLIKDKNLSVQNFITNTLCKTQSMFYYKNLPTTIPQNELEKILQTNGYAFITEIDNNLYAFSGGLCGNEKNVYNEPTEIIINNVALNLNKTFNISDGILIKNDSYMYGLLNIIAKYAVLLTDVSISLNTCAVLNRINALISVSDDKTKESAELFIKKILDGDFSILVENAFLKGVNVQNINTSNNNVIQNLIELTQYYKANLLNELGLNANFNMKRERLNESEILLNSDDLLPFVNNMLQCRKKAINELNEKYNLNVSVDLQSSWKTEKEINDKATETENTETEIENEFVSRENEEIKNENDIVNIIREMRENEIKENENNENN